MRRGLQDALISAGALALVMIVLVSIDDRVREHYASIVRTVASPSGLTAAGAQIRDAAAVVLLVARDRSVEHAPVVIFVSAAVLLVVFMLRT
jgi:hypothetical protein